MRHLFISEFWLNLISVKTDLTSDNFLENYSKFCFLNIFLFIKLVKWEVRIWLISIFDCHEHFYFNNFFDFFFFFFWQKWASILLLLIDLMKTNDLQLQSDAYLHHQTPAVCSAASCCQPCDVNRTMTLINKRTSPSSHFMDFLMST